LARIINSTILGLALYHVLCNPRHLRYVTSSRRYFYKLIYDDVESDCWRHSLQATLSFERQTWRRADVSSLSSSLSQVATDFVSREFVVLQQKVSIFNDNNGSPGWQCNCALDSRPFLAIYPENWLKNR